MRPWFGGLLAGAAASPSRLQIGMGSLILTGHKVPRESSVGLSISAFFPAYNDAATIASMVMGAVRTLEKLSGDYEVIVVDDGSRDATAEVLEELERLYPGRLRVERHARNRGYGAALRTGIASATKEWIFYTDGDAQYDPRELALLAGHAGDHVDLVNGYKIARSDPVYRKLIGALYNLFVKVAFRVRIRDVDCDFRLMRRACLEKLKLKSTSGTICVEMIKKLQDSGCRFVEVPVHHFHRSVGRSQFFRPYWLLKTFRDLLALWWELMLPRPGTVVAGRAGLTATESPDTEPGQRPRPLP